MGTGTAGPDGGRFVGRDAELAELRTRVSAAAAGSGGLVLLSGPAGIGKTRTVEEVLAAAPLPVAWGRCVDDPGAPPLWPWRRVVRALPAVAAAVAGALAEVDRAGGGADPDAARFRLATAVTDALLDCAAAGGLVVVLEDLHWADESSLRLLRHLAGELTRSRLLVVGTVRDPDGARTGRPLDAALPGLLREPGVRALRLPPLSEDDVRAYLPAGSPEVVHAVHRRSGGVPLYLRAVARSPGAGAGGQAELRALVRTTLTALPPAALDLLDAAAVLGEELDAAQLAAVTGRPADEVAAGLDAAVHGGVLAAVPDAPGRRRFAHAAVRDAVYADLAPSVREELHRRAAEALERLAGDGPADDTLAGLVVGHWLRAPAGPATLRRAAGWARRAAATATRLLAFDEAARFLATALDAGQRAGADRAERAALLVDLATAEFRAGRFDAALEHALAASDAAAGDPELLAAAALTVHDVGAPEFPPALVRMCERALAAVDGEGSPALRSRLLSQLASVQADAGRMGAAARNAAEALDLARGCGDSEAVLDAVRARMKASPTALGVAERLDLGRLAIEHAAGTGQPLVELWGAKWRIDAGLETGDMDVVRDEVDRVSALAASTRLPLVRWHDRRLRASLAALLGRFDEAVALNEEARAIGATELAGDLSAVGLSDAFGLQHALVTGRGPALDDDVLATLDRAGDVPVVLVSRALVDLLRGRRDEAAARYQALRERLADADFVASGGVPLNLVPLVEEFGDVAAAEVLHGQLAREPYAAGGAGVYCQGSYASLVARLAVVRGRLDEAVRWFEEALAVDTGTGARPATVHDRVGLAGALLDRGQPADLARAGTLARSAAGEARRLGMPGPERRAAELADRADRAVRRADPLTTREREIAVLVARAWTNRRIAEELVLSERTVESHVRNVLAKLGAANRTELATLIGRP